MRVVVDTNVIAYYLLQTEGFFDEVKTFWEQVTDPLAPSSWRAELANTLWLAIRAERVPRGDAVQHLRDADALEIESTDINELWESALLKAADNNHPAYDVLFVELAQREGIGMATFDSGVLAKFPDVAKRPRDLT